jgi:hypothetical protein
VFKWRTVAAALVVAAIIVSGCGDGAGTTTTAEGVSSPDDIVFGEGEMPATIPAEFPLPTGSAIGSTMVVTTTGFTEMVVRISADQGVTAEYFNESLKQSGFTVDVSEANQDAWLIEFTYQDTHGTIDISTPTAGISQAVIRYNVP